MYIFDKNLYELKKESESLYCEIIGKIGKQKAYYALGRYNRGFYGKTQAQLITEYNKLGLSIKDNKISNYFDKVHYAYRIAGFRMFLLDINRKSISRDTEGLTERAHTNGVACRENFIHTLKEMHFNWSTPEGDLRYLIKHEGKRTIPAFDVDRLRKMYTLMNQNLGVMEQSLFQNTRFESSITNLIINDKVISAKTTPIKIKETLKTDVPIQLTLFDTLSEETISTNPNLSMLKRK